ncbi:unnamed protein product [Blepharisma stoltei]|uniref:Uncharacterized protein n=1 Tax=Blepharisma stoltei TaxID=1481888 RepID=A0AAU9IFS7_9CILI|nr:unnamed protein product [Blepharisma stoltei]
MGSCCSNRSVQIISENQLPVDSILKTRIVDPSKLENVELIISEYAARIKGEFENKVEKFLEPANPLTLQQFESMIKSQYDQLSGQFKELFINEESGWNVPFELIEKSLSALLSSCKAKEPIFRLMNDINSVEYTNALKLELLEEFLLNHSSPVVLLKKYQKSSKGTFVMQGLSELYELINSSDKEPQTLKTTVHNQLKRARESLSIEKSKAETMYYGVMNLSWHIIPENDVFSNKGDTENREFSATSMSTGERPYNSFYNSLELTVENLEHDKCLEVEGKIIEENSEFYLNQSADEEVIKDDGKEKKQTVVSNCDTSYTTDRKIEKSKPHSKKKPIDKNFLKKSKTSATVNRFVNEGLEKLKEMPYNKMRKNAKGDKT